MAAFLMDFAVITSITVMPFYVFNQLGGGAAMSGTIGAVQGAFYAAICLLSAPYVSRAKNGLDLAMAGAAGFTVFICLVPFFRAPLICGAVATLAMASLALFWPAMYSWVGAEPDLHVRARRIAALNVSWSSGFAAGPLFAGSLYDYDYRLPFVLILGIEVFILVLVKSLPHERDHFLLADAQALEDRAEHDRASEMHLHAAWLANFLSSLIAAVTRNVFPKQVKELVDAGRLRLLFESQPPHVLTIGAATKYSWLAFALGLVIVLTFILMGHTRRWHHNFKLLLGVQVLAGVGFWFLGRTTSLVLMTVCFMAIGANCGVTFFAAVYYSIANPELKHRRAAINEGGVGLGGFVGSIAFGFLAGQYGMAMPFKLVPALMAVALLAQIILLRSSGSRQLRLYSALGQCGTSHRILQK